MGLPTGVRPSSGAVPWNCKEALKMGRGGHSWLAAPEDERTPLSSIPQFWQ